MSIFLIIPSLSYTVFSLNNNEAENKKIIGRLSKEIEIPASSDYFIKFSINNLTLDGKNTPAFSSGLSEKIVYAIAKSPKWIQRRLTLKFQTINNDTYADLILGSDIKYVDEIAFCIACSSFGNVPGTDIILDNVLTLYEIDEMINYADIVDYDDESGNYYSTIKYRVIENGTVKELELPPEIYYWYVVHPRLTGEKAEYIYGEFWRNYLFNHNDIGYPLLKEKLSNIFYLWDCESYFQGNARTWNWSMSNHPTAIEVISYWVGKTVNQQAYGDRPSQVNIIAHEHNGWCGELQIVAVAAQRTALIPSVGVFDTGEDHVWREFFERGWHENDNWWADGGGAVDEPDIYAYGWGKDMSALYAKNGDSSIYEVTSTYIHSEDRVSVDFNVLDRRLNPVDGARVVVMVWGPKDITFIKNKFFEITQKIWDSIPNSLKIRIIKALYEKINDKISKIPDSVDGPIYCIWNYTDLNGSCLFELGKNRSYIFIVQYGNLKNPLLPARFNAFRFLDNPVDKKFIILNPFLTPIKYKHLNFEMPEGDVFFDVSFDTKSYQVQNALYPKYGEIIYEKEGKIDFFIVDEENFGRYNQGLSFKCYNYLNIDECNFSISAPQNNYYFVFKNNCRNSNVILNFTLSSLMQISDEKVQIVKPNTDIFDNPILNIGEKIIISGIATDNFTLFINNESYGILLQNYQWSYEWVTNNLTPGVYLIKAICGDVKDEAKILLIDKLPPKIEIDFPFDKEIIEAEEIVISGKSFDNQDVKRVEVSLDNSAFLLANGTDFWEITWDISSFGLGNHNISVRAFDASDCVSFENICFVLNETGHSWTPSINSFYHKPERPTNVSNVIIYANVTTTSPFVIEKILLYWDDEVNQESTNMFRYADNPAQMRHEEDPLNNESNDPIFGFELGQFLTGKNITYWIEAFDSANNSIVSNVKSFYIE